MIKIVTFTPVWQRPEVFEICLKGIRRLKKYKPEQFEIIPFFMVSEDRAAEMVAKYGFRFIYVSNDPLGKKKNVGLKYVMNNLGEFDYLLEIGSDDLIRNEYLDFCLPELENRTPLFNPADVWFYDILTGKTAYWITDKVLGLGRFIAYNALLKFSPGYELWEPERNRGMDTYSLKRMELMGVFNKLIQTDNVYTLDIKSELNINLFSRFMPHPMTGGELLKFFPEAAEIKKLAACNL